MIARGRSHWLAQIEQSKMPAPENINANIQLPLVRSGAINAHGNTHKRARIAWDGYGNDPPAQHSDLVAHGEELEVALGV